MSTRATRTARAVSDGQHRLDLATPHEDIEQPECPHCKGEGRVPELPDEPDEGGDRDCDYCDGTGRESPDHDYEPSPPID